MTGFSADWLALREPADARARWPDATTRLNELLSRSRSSSRHPGPILDLGSGTGSNCRYLAPRLREPHDWLLVDYDRVLLAQASATCGALPAVRSLRTVEVDLSAELQRLPCADAALLTASALLDLVSLPWLTQLAELCRAAALPALFALSYDGRMAMTPQDPDDAFIRDAVNEHQRGDKGFGPALGPDSVSATRSAFAACGYQVSSARSDWQLDARDASLQRALIAGWAQAAVELHTDAAVHVQRWVQRRNAMLDAGSSRMIVGHEDLLALPGAATAR